MDFCVHKSVACVSVSLWLCVELWSLSVCHLSLFLSLCVSLRLSLFPAECVSALLNIHAVLQQQTPHDEGAAGQALLGAQLLRVSGGREAKKENPFSGTEWVSPQMVSSQAESLVQSFCRVSTIPTLDFLGRNQIYGFATGLDFSGVRLSRTPESETPLVTKHPFCRARLSQCNTHTCVCTAIHFSSGLQPHKVEP